MDPFAASITVGVVVLAVVNFVKYIRAGVKGQGWNGAVTMFVAFVIAWLVLLLFRETVWGLQVTIGDHSLQNLNILDLVPVAIAAASVGSVIFDTLNSIDGSSSAAKPPLTGQPTDTTPTSVPPSQPGTHV